MKTAQALAVASMVLVAAPLRKAAGSASSTFLRKSPHINRYTSD